MDVAVDGDLGPPGRGGVGLERVVRALPRREVLDVVEADQLLGHGVLGDPRAVDAAREEAEDVPAGGEVLRQFQFFAVLLREDRVRPRIAAAVGRAVERRADVVLRRRVAEDRGPQQALADHLGPLGRDVGHRELPAEAPRRRQARRVHRDAVRAKVAPDVGRLELERLLVLVLLARARGDAAGPHEVTAVRLEALVPLDRVDGAAQRRAEAHAVVDHRRQHVDLQPPQPLEVAPGRRRERRGAHRGEAEDGHGDDGLPRTEIAQTSGSRAASSSDSRRQLQCRKPVFAQCLLTIVCHRSEAALSRRRDTFYVTPLPRASPCT